MMMTHAYTFCTRTVKLSDVVGTVDDSTTIFHFVPKFKLSIFSIHNDLTTIFCMLLVAWLGILL